MYVRRISHPSTRNVISPQYIYTSRKSQNEIGFVQDDIRVIFDNIMMEVLKESLWQ